MIHALSSMPWSSCQDPPGDIFLDLLACPWQNLGLLRCAVWRLAALEGELHGLARLVGADCSHDSVKRLHTHATHMYDYTSEDDSDDMHAHRHKDQDARAHCPTGTLQHVCYTAADAMLAFPSKANILSISHHLCRHMLPKQLT